MLVGMNDYDKDARAVPAALAVSLSRRKFTDALPPLFTLQSHSSLPANTESEFNAFSG